jgi:hypothetical protein
MTCITQGGWPTLIVALDQGANPGGTVPGDLDNMLGTDSLHNQPNDVPMSTCDPVFLLEVPSLSLLLADRLPLEFAFSFQQRPTCFFHMEFKGFDIRDCV